MKMECCLSYNDVQLTLCPGLKTKQEELQRAVAAMKKVRSALKRWTQTHQQQVISYVQCSYCCIPCQDFQNEFFYKFKIVFLWMEMFFYLYALYILYIYLSFLIDLYLLLVYNFLLVYNKVDYTTFRSKQVLWLDERHLSAYKHNIAVVPYIA